MTRVLVTGANGFVGGHLSAYVDNLGLEVHGLGRRPAPGGWKGLWHEVSLLDHAALASVVAAIKPDYVFHFAALLKSSTLQDLLHVNVAGTDNLLAAIYNNFRSARILVAGSAAEYGLVPANELPISETCPLRPLGPYGLSKAAQGLLAWQYYQRYGLEVVRTRTFNLTGPGEPETQVVSSVARQIARIEARGGSRELLVGNLDAVRDFIDVRDAARAYWLVALKGKPGEVYNVCSGHGVRIGMILNRLLGMTSSQVSVRQVAERFTPGDVPVQVGNVARLQVLSDFRCTFSLDDSLSQLLDEARDRERMNCFGGVIE